MHGCSHPAEWSGFLNHAHDVKQNDRSDRCCDNGADQAIGSNSKKAKDKTADNSANDTNDNVAE